LSGDSYHQNTCRENPTDMLHGLVNSDIDPGTYFLILVSELASNTREQ